MTASGSCLRIVAAICLIAAAPPAAADLAAAIADCRARSATGEVEFDLAVAGCPAVVDVIESGDWAASMPPGWQETLTFRELEGLVWFDSLYGAATGAGGVRLPDTLDRIVDELGDLGPAPDTRSLWERFMDWLRDRTGGDAADPPGWLSEWLSDVELPTRAIEITFWILTAIIIIAAIAVIVIEVRAARGAASRRFDQHTVAGAGDGRSVRRPPQLGDLDRAALEDRPSILLCLLLQKMEQLGIAERRPSTTHRELCTVAATLEEPDGDALSDVSWSAEQIRFGGHAADPVRLGHIVSAGRALLDRLEPGRRSGA